MKKFSAFVLSLHPMQITSS